MLEKLHTPRWAWVLTGSGHFFTESFELIHGLEHCDVFVSKAANEVLRMYKLKLDFPETMRVLHDKTASAVPVGAVRQLQPSLYDLHRHQRRNLDADVDHLPRKIRLAEADQQLLQPRPGQMSRDEDQPLSHGRPVRRG
jgi:hypothetical protein